FGFLTRGEGTPDIFVHVETLRRFGIAELRPGQFVLVRYGAGPKGLIASEVRPEGATMGRSSHRFAAGNSCLLRARRFTGQPGRDDQVPLLQCPGTNCPSD